MTNKSKIIAITSTTILAGIILGTININSNTAQAQEGTVPNWIKTNAKWWSDGQVSTGEYISALQFLISNDIIQGTRICDGGRCTS